MFVLLDEDRVQRRVEIGAVADPRRLDRLQRVEHAAGADRQARLAQGAREIEDVLGEPSGAARRLRDRFVVADGCAVNGVSRLYSAQPLACSTCRITAALARSTALSGTWPMSLMRQLSLPSVAIARAVLKQYWCC